MVRGGVEVAKRHLVNYICTIGALSFLILGIIIYPEAGGGTMGVVSAKVIGANVAKYRNAAGMTQAQLAERVGVSTPFLSRVERGEKLMKLKTFLAIAQSLDVSCDALLREDGPKGHLENINVLLSGKPAGYLCGIEQVVRACMEAFPPPQDSEGSVELEEPAPTGDTADGSPEP